MKSKALCGLVALVCCVSAANAAVVGTLLPGTRNARDMVYDAKRGLIYIALGKQMLRYDVAGATFLAPVAFAGNVNGIDLSPDGNTIAVADGNGARIAGVLNIYLHRVNADTLVDNVQAFPQDRTVDSGSGTFSVAYGGNGDMLVSETVDGSGFTEARLYTAATNTWARLAAFMQDTMFTTSGDGRVIGYIFPNDSGGDWGTYGVFSKTWRNETFQGAFLIDVGISHNGVQVATMWKSGAAVWTNLTGPYYGVTGTGGVYDPVRMVGYFPQQDQSTVIAFNMNTQKPIATYDFGKAFTHDQPIFGLGVGRTRISPDGSLLMAISTDGVHILDLYAPLSAANVSAQAVTGQSVAVTALGSIGVAGAALTYTVPQKPAHGTVSVAGSTITYTPDSGYNGTDTFQYQAGYGRATAIASVAVNVHPNQPPVAVADSILVHDTTPVLVPVLANDSDPDGQALSVIAVTTPPQGSVAIQGNQILYTPPAGSTSSESFQYTISDGHGGTASARVVARVRP